MPRHDKANLEVVCPCCGARLTIDASLSQVVAHEGTPRPAKAPDLDHVGQILQKEAARREARFKQSAEEEKVKSQLRERKFEEALKKSKDEPLAPPRRDIDLD